MNMMWVGIGIAVVLVVLCALLFQRYVRRQDDGRDDRYAPERILSAQQVSMLDYLHDTFPGQVVLPNVGLRQMLSVRRAVDKKTAKERLADLSVDFVVCAPDGRPTFAFDIERHHLANAEARTDAVKRKNRMLRTAGVRFVFLKDGIHRMPSPADFRAQLNLAELPKPKAGAEVPSRKLSEADRDSVLKDLESQLSGFDHLYSGNTGFRDSEVMGLSGLMDLDPDAERRSTRGDSRHGVLR